jgi:hypothetical protein
MICCEKVIPFSCPSRWPGVCGLSEQPPVTRFPIPDRALGFIPLDAAILLAPGGRLSARRRDHVALRVGSRALHDSGKLARAGLKSLRVLDRFLQVANAFLQLAFGLMFESFGLLLLAPNQLPGLFLNLAAEVFQFAFDLIFVDGHDESLGVS